MNQKSKIKYQLSNIKNLCIIIIALLSLTNLKTVFADSWETTLKQNFDIVDTFDELEDWGSGLTGDPNVVVTTNLPQKISGGQGIIDAWQWDGSGPIKGNAIANHGSDNVFRSTGKSLKLGYDWQGEGPAKIVVVSHDGDANAGYDEPYIFYMVKLPNVLPNDGQKFYWWDAMKHFYLTMGWKSAKQYGTDEFYESSIVTYPPSIASYGVQNIIINFHGGSHGTGRVDILTQVFLAMFDCSSYARTGDFTNAVGFNSEMLNEFKDIWHFPYDIGQYQLSKEWFGIEWRFKKGTANTPDAEIELWVYDVQGNVVYNGWVKNFIAYKTCTANGQTWFDNEMNKFNKFNWGQNRLRGYGGYTNCYGVECSEAPPGEKQFADPSVTDHFNYLDDIIIDDQRIGPTYFALLSGTQNTTPPAPPTGLRVE